MDKFGWVLAIAYRYLLLIAGVSAVVIASSDFPLVLFRVCMVVGAIGAVLALLALARRGRSVTVAGRILGVGVLIVGFAINVLLLVRPPGWNLGLTLWTIGILALTIGATYSGGRRRAAESSQSKASSEIT